MPQRDRIDSLDILRGLAILGILLMNLPGFGTYYVAFFGNAPLAGWTPADQLAWKGLEIFAEGTQRGLLQLLFGAGMILFTARAMQPEGPVEVADRWFRRNLWLVAFGLLHVFVLLFPGDILFIYGLAALLAFPFRRLSARWLLVLGLAWTVVDGGRGLADYLERRELQQQVQAGEPAAIESWAGLAQEFDIPQEALEGDRELRLAPYPVFAEYARATWVEQRAKSLEVFFISVPEALCGMLLGAALFKWGVVQGQRSRRFYLLLLLAGYAIALPLRWVEVVEHLRFDPAPRLVWFTEEIARWAMTLGHLAAVHLLLGSRPGRRLLAPFKAVGRTAFSLYLMQSVVAGWLIFPGIGLGLFAQFGWAAMTGIALAIMAAQVLLANLWLRLFAMGPLEWLWRSLVEWRRLPFARAGAGGSAEGATA